MNKIYTKFGDKGKTQLVGGTSISKSTERIDLYGEVDHLNSIIGIGIAHLQPIPNSNSNSNFDIKKSLEQIQHWLFNVGSNLACESNKRNQYKIPQLKKESVSFLEDQIDQMDEQLNPLTFFILPGGSPSSSFFHMARTQSRNLERKMVLFIEHNPSDFPAEYLCFINRLSDYFFTLSRYLNKQHSIPESRWCP